MTDHRHLVDSPITNGVCFCRCGAVYRVDKERWEQPRYPEGIARASRWQGEE